MISVIPKTLKASKANSSSSRSINSTVPWVILRGSPAWLFIGTATTSVKSNNCFETVACRIADSNKVPTLDINVSKESVSIDSKSCKSKIKIASKILVNSV